MKAVNRFLIEHYKEKIILMGFYQTEISIALASRLVLIQTQPDLIISLSSLIMKIITTSAYGIEDSQEPKW